MKILLCSYWFFPNFGGVETTSRIFAEEFTRAGHTVTVLTDTAADPGKPMESPFDVVRKASGSTVRALARQSDVMFQNMISLRTLVNLLPSRKPIVVTHQSWMRRNDGTLGPENHLKRLMTRFCTNVSISRSIADTLPVPSRIIGNPFEADEFLPLREKPRYKDLVFMGRLVSDKGCALLLEALGMLKGKGLTPTLTIIGDGPEREPLAAQVGQLGVGDQVTFLGALREGRGEVVAQHRVLVVPSRWAEPFGVVALEGIASGCAVIASNGGGLPEAAGPCGLFFPNGDSAALAGRLEEVLTQPTLERQLVDAGPAHIRNFEPSAIARQYLEIFASLAL
ncbi:MAG: glycosyltransferase family 4 protein [Rhodospirillales bacterium]|nr:glycosyltransferase family 4 protein [Acetobacter sp.]